MSIADAERAISRRAQPSRSRPHLWRVFPLLGVLSLMAFGIAVALGPAEISLSETVSIVLHRLGMTTLSDVPTSHALIVGEIRLPRALAAGLVGSILAVSGGVMQGIFRNPLASPYLLGIASGASAGAALVIVLGLRQFIGGFALPVGAFLGGALAVMTVYGLAQTKSGQASPHTLILAGIALGAFFSAITSSLIFLSGEQMVEIVFWIMGGLGRATWTYLAWLTPPALIGLLVLVLFSRDLNALALGDEGARHLGIEPERLKRMLLLIVTAMTGAAVAVAGTIGFVGLITPHALRLIVGPDHRVLLPASALSGTIFLMATDTVSRTVWAPLELPVGIITAFFGAPFFLYLLLTRRGGEMG